MLDGPVETEKTFVDGKEQTDRQSKLPQQAGDV